MRNRIIVGKMINCANKVLSYSKGMDYQSFSQNTITVEACIFNLSQLGELTTKLDKDYMANYPDIPWNEMRGLRNKIVHDYEGVNLRLIWEIVSGDLPELKNQLEKIL